MNRNNTELDQPVMQNVLKLLSTALNQDKNEDFLPDLSLWPAIKAELKYHAVLSLVSDIMADSKLPDSEKNELIINTAVNIRSFHALMKAQTAVLELLKANHISAAVMKGAAAAQYYPNPRLRQYGDIDILVPPDDYKRTFELLCASGYKNQQEYDAFFKRHIGFKTPEGRELELHRFFSSSSRGKENSLLDHWLYENVKNVEQVNLEGYMAPVFPALENGLILLGHINQHLSSGLGFRQIIDWMLYVRAVLTDQFWEEAFQHKASALGMDTLAITVTKMCQKYLGLTCELTWCAGADDTLIDDLLLYVFKKGNFGNKIETNSRLTISIAHRFTNPVNTFRYLTTGGSLHMTEAGLKPRKAYAWLYQIGHLLHKTFSRDTRDSVAKEIKCGVQEADLLKRLKVTRI